MKLALLKKKKEAKDTMSFYFKKPKGFDYLPGQFIYLTLEESMADSRGPTRHFTIASSPTEDDLMVTTRIRAQSIFKKHLSEMKKGDTIEAEGPNGTFIVDEKEGHGPHVFLAGGIGVTPFRSFIKYSIDKKTGGILHLIYSNKTKSEIAYHKELVKIAKENKNIKVDFTLTREKWDGLTGRVDKKMLRKLIKNIKKSHFFVSGPPGFVNAMESVLEEVKSEEIRTEKFTGY